MNDQSWIKDIQWQDQAVPPEGINGEEIYTLTMSDFLAMPDVDFGELTAFDPHLRSLLN